MEAMKILKFGGSSVSTAERIKDVGRIVLRAAKKERIVVVVSAFQGVTNQLLECARLAEKGDRSFVPLYNKLVHRHVQALSELTGRSSKKSSHTIIQEQLDELRNVLQGI